MATRGFNSDFTLGKMSSYKKYLDSVQNGIKDNTNPQSQSNPLTNPSRDNYATYKYDYFSGTDCKVFFGDIWVDDIITIQYSVSQSKTPIYGYASQNFDAVARGLIIVEGQLTIAFKEVAYLNVIQQYLNQEQKKIKAALGNALANYGDEAGMGKAKYIPRLSDSLGTNTGFNAGTTTAQFVRQQQTIEDILIDKKNSSNGRDFEDAAKLMEDTIWGDNNGNSYQSKENVLTRVDEFDYSHNKSTGEDTGGIKNVKELGNYSDCLNILLTFGEINDFRAEHTMVALNDVHFTSTTMIVSPSGDPIAEVYNFFARDINKSLNNTAININPIKFNIGVDADLPSLQSMDAVANAIASQGLKNQFKVTIISTLTKDGWGTPESQIGHIQPIMVSVDTNSSMPYVDQVSLAVEKAINDQLPETFVQASSQLMVRCEAI